MIEKIIKILNKHKGKDRAITVQEIADELNHFDSGLTNPVLRSLITKIVVEKKIPIASCSKGYFKISNQDEYLEYIDNLENRVKGIKSRIHHITNAYLNN